MASPVVFKLRVVSPRSRDAPARNRAHVFYIGKRPGVELNEGMYHGLFGKTSGNDFGQYDNIRETADYVHQKTKEGTIMYRAIISLAEADALQLGYDSKESWENLVKENILDIAEKIGVPPSRLEYIAAVHMDKGHPHVHLMLWDKEQEVKKAFVHPSVSNKIRIELTKRIYKDELETLYQIKNAARDSLMEDSGDFLKSFFEPFERMTPKDYQVALDKLKSDPEAALGRLLNKRLSSYELDNLALKIFDFKEKLPEKGRLNYKLLPPELKSELEDIVTELVSVNPDFRAAFEAYVNTSVEIASFYNSDPEALEKARQKAEDELIRRLSNKLLSLIKNIDQRHYKSQKEQKNKSRCARVVFLDLS